RRDPLSIAFPSPRAVGSGKSAACGGRMPASRHGSEGTRVAGLRAPSWRMRGHVMLQGKKVAILVAEGFEQSEMTEPRKALEEAGARTEIVSPAKGEVQGWNHFDK